MQTEKKTDAWAGPLMQGGLAKKRENAVEPGIEHKSPCWSSKALATALCLQLRYRIYQYNNQIQRDFEKNRTVLFIYG